MKKLLFMLACFISILVIGSAYAVDKIIIKQLTGEVVTIDVSIKTLTVRGKKAEVVIMTDDNTIVKTGREKKTLADIKVGDKIKVKYAVIDGKNIARFIDINLVKTDGKGTEAPKPAKPVTRSGY